MTWPAGRIAVGIRCAAVSWPWSFALGYPPGQSQDANRRVQLDGHHNLQGGVPPDIHVLLTGDTLYARFAEGMNVALQRAIEASQAR